MIPNFSTSDNDANDNNNDDDDNDNYDDDNYDDYGDYDDNGKDEKERVCFVVGGLNYTERDMIHVRVHLFIRSIKEDGGCLSMGLRRLGSERMHFAAT